MVFVVGQGGTKCNVCRFLHFSRGNIKHSLQCFECKRWFHATDRNESAVPSHANVTEPVTTRIENPTEMKAANDDVPKAEETIENKIADEPLLDFASQSTVQRKDYLKEKISTKEIILRVCPTDSGYSSKISSPISSTVPFSANELKQRSFVQPRFSACQVQTKRKRHKNSSCGECSKDFRDIETEDASVQCDECLLWFCGRCVPPDSYNDIDPYFCFLCITTYDNDERAAAKRRIKRKNQLGPILCCSNHWCSYYVQVDARNGTSLSKAQYILKRHTEGCERQYKTQLHWKAWRLLIG